MRKDWSNVGFCAVDARSPSWVRFLKDTSRKLALFPDHICHGHDSAQIIWWSLIWQWLSKSAKFNFLPVLRLNGGYTIDHN